MYKCIDCNIDMIWQSDFDFEDCGYEGEGIVSFYMCPKCEELFEVLIDFNNDDVVLNRCCTEEDYA